ncbi:MAG: hypothetical protein K2H22_03535 [Muribaculaceae bacterium]|nr:hypothetical protein [Muribaculaceae bacterium]
MNVRILIAAMAAGCLCSFGCTQERDRKDRAQATEMFHRICRLTEDYIERLETAQDSASWATACIEYEDKLEKISFSYPPDTDLLLTEGQNDTIHSLMQEYVGARERRIHGILHPVVEVDSLAASDSAVQQESLQETTASRQDASRSHGN